MLSDKIIVQVVKSIMAIELFRLYPEVKRQLWADNFWTVGYFVNTVGQYATELVIQNYIKNQRYEKRNILGFVKIS